nr:MAG TPA: hypothetical protein [Caudoviricetes sp.]
MTAVFRKRKQYWLIWVIASLKLSGFHGVLGIVLIFPFRLEGVCH